MKEQTLTEKQLQIVKANPVKSHKLALGVAGAALTMTLFLAKPTTNVHAAVVDGNHNADSVSQNTSNNDTKDDLVKTVDEQNETLQALKTDAPKASDFASQPQTTQTAETHDDVQIIDHTQENGQNKQQKQPVANAAVTDPNEVPVIVDHTQGQTATTRPDIPVEVVSGSQTDASIGQDNNIQTATPTKKKKGLQGRDGTSRIYHHDSENITGDDSSWQNVNYDYDLDKNILTIYGGKITNPKSVFEQFKNIVDSDKVDPSQKFPERITVILSNAGSNLKVSGNVSSLFGYIDGTNTVNSNSRFKSFKGLSISGLYYLKFDNVTDTSLMFANAIIDINSDDLANLDTSQVTNMSAMFYNCQLSEHMDSTLEINFNTSNVKDMSNMFNGFKVTALNVSKFDTHNVENMRSMFKNMVNVTDIVGLDNFVTNNVTDMSSMFYHDTEISSLDDISNWNISKVTDLSRMFQFDYITKNDLGSSDYHVSSLKSLDLTNWDTSNVKYFGYMFANTYMDEIDISNFKFTGLDKDFYGSEQNDISDPLAADSVKYAISGMFYDSKFSKLDVSNFDFSHLTNTISFANIFSNCSYLTNLIGYENWDVSHANSFENLFCFTDLVSLDLSNWNTNNVINMSNTFANCHLLTNIALSNWNTDNVTNMSGMFDDCQNLENLDVFKWHTNNVINMAYMFRFCNKLKDINVSKWNTSKVTNFFDMFYDCNSLKSLDLSNFDTKSADPNHFFGPFGSMLTDLSSLKQLTLGPKSFLVIFDDNNDVSTDAGLNNIGAWIAVADGTIDKPKGRKLYTSDQLMKDWNGSQGIETFVLTNKIFHDVKINYVDADTKQVLATDTIQGFDGATIDYATLYHDQLVKLGKQHYIRDTSADTVKFDNNHDVMMPDTVTDGLSYNIGVKKQFNVTINYVDLNTGKIIATDQITGNSSTPIAYSAKLKQRLADLTKAGYTVVNGGKNVPLNADNDLQLPADINVDLTYTYGIRSQFPITINYVDETGKILAHDELKGNIDTEIPYKSIYDKQIATLKAKGYTVVDSDLAFNGQNKAENLKLPDDAKVATTFTVHLKAAAYNVTVNYVDADTGKVVKTDNVSGSKLEPIKYADTRKQSLAELNNQGYVVVDDNTPLDAKGDIQLPDSVTDDVTYTVNVKEVHDVNIAYVDADTQKVLTSETVKGNSHKPLDYKSRYDELVAEYAKKGYELVKTDLPFDASGNIQLPADKHDDFNYKVYLREVHQVTVNYVDLDTGKVVKTDTVKGNSHIPIAYADQMKQALAELAQKGYTFDQKDSALPVDKNGDIQLPADLTGNVTYQVGVRTKKAPVSDNQPATVVGVIVHYRDNKGNQLAPDEQIVGQVGSSYLTHAKEIPGYTLETVRGHATGTIGQQTTKVTYYYVKDSDKQTEVPVKPNDNNQQPIDNSGNKKPDKNGKHDNNKQDAKKPAIIDHGMVIINPDGKDQVKIVDKTGKTVAHKQVSDPKQAVIKPQLPQTGMKNGWSMVVSGLTMMLLAVGSALGFKRKDEK